MRSLTLRKSLARWAAPFAVLLGYYSVTGYETVSLLRWSQLEVGVAAYSLIFFALGSVAAGLDWQLNWRDLAHTVARVPLAGSNPTPGAVLLATSAWIGVGWLAGVLLGIDFLSREALLLGSPRLLFLSVPAATLVLGAALGLVVGEVTPRYVGPLLFSILGYVAIGGAMYSGAAVRKLVPIADGATPIGREIVDKTLILQLALYVLIILCACVLLASRCATTASRIVVSGFGLSALAIALLLPSQTVFGPSTGATTVCSEGGGITICGPSELRRGFRPIAEAADRVFSVIGQQLEGIRIDRGGATHFWTDSGTLDASFEELQAQATDRIARLLVQPAAGVGCDNYRANQVVGDALAQVATGRSRPASPAAAALAPVIVRDPEWVSSRLARLASCDVTFREVAAASPG